MNSVYPNSSPPRHSSLRTSSDSSIKERPKIRAAASRGSVPAFSVHRLISPGMNRYFLLILIAMTLTQTARAQQPSESPFEYHGVVEGFYGTPWSHEARLDMVRFSGEVGFNTFFYAPKDDPYHRSRWREPYPPEDLDRFRELFAASQQAGVTLYYAISPGLSIEYSSDEDYDALIAKIDAMMEQGVRHFAFFVDDVPEELAHEADKERFANLGEAHVHLINRLHADLAQRRAHLIVCPTTYSNSFGDREYITILGEGVAQDVPIFWTGVDVAVERITAAETRDWGRLINRKPLIWDNFPVNDYDAWRPFVGPLRGRSPELGDVSSGFIANPMVEPYLSMVPLYTVAEYVLDPVEYDPEASWLRALEFLYGEEAAEEIEPVLRLYDDFGWDHNLFRSLYAPGAPIRIGEIEDALDLIDQTVAFLRDDRFTDNQRLQGSLDELEKFRTMTSERIGVLRSTEGYREKAGARGRLLVFDTDRDRFVANPARNVQTDDGRMCEWTGYAFHPLHGGGDVHAAFQYDDEFIYIAVDVRDVDLRPGDQHTIWDGDHIAIAVDYAPSDTARHMKPGDVMLQLGAPDPQSGESITMLSTMNMTEHAARGAMDLQRSRLSHFFQFFTDAPGPEHQERFERIQHSVTRSEDGYFAEIAVPREGADRFRLDVGYFNVDQENGRTSAGGTLSRRGYLFNPKAYATVELK